MIEQIDIMCVAAGQREFTQEERAEVEEVLLTGLSEYTSMTDFKFIPDQILAKEHTRAAHAYVFDMAT